MPILERRSARVRPRSPSSDRLRQRPIRSISGVQERLRYRALRGGISPQVALAGLAVGLVVSIFMLTVGLGLAIGLVSEAGKAIGDAVSRVASEAPATAAPSGVALDTPVFDPPANDGFTSQPTVVLSGTVPRAVVGKSGYYVRVYAVAPDDSRTAVTDAPVGSTTRFSTDVVTLTEGRNTFAAVLAGPSGEGNSSPPIVYTLDTKPPQLTISSPPPNTYTKASSVTIKGRSEEGVTVSVRNRQAPGGALNSKVLDAGATFELSVRLVPGDNTIDVTATDQADNSTSTTLFVKRDYGQLAAHLTASPTKINSAITTALTLTVHATSSTGSPLADATVVFTVNVSGLGPIISPELRTDATGAATWATTIAGAVPGSGWASVLVTSDMGDQIQGSTSLNAY
jgi:hypothetical protein